MKIDSNFNSVQLKQNNVRNVQAYGIRKSLPADSVSFTAHAQSEILLKKGFMQLIHQTAFDREPQTKRFVCDYISTHFGGKDKINIVSAGCSTGEEAVTYSMLLYNMKNKVDILGFDLGKKAIKQAQSKKYVFEIPNPEYDFQKELGMQSPYSDIYLISDKEQGLTPDQKWFKSLFHEFFEPTNEKIRTPFGELLRNMIAKRNGEAPLELERKAYKLRNGMAENCKFVQGDVMDIDKILDGEKADVISFSNALYHLTAIDMFDTRIPKKNAEKTIEKLMTKFKNCLNKDGIVVFGEDEGPQLGDMETVPKVMKRLGFIPLNKTSTHAPNVWKRGK